MVTAKYCRSPCHQGGHEMNSWKDSRLLQWQLPSWQSFKLHPFLKLIVYSGLQATVLQVHGSLIWQSILTKQYCWAFPAYLGLNMQQLKPNHMTKATSCGLVLRCCMTLQSVSILTGTSFRKSPFTHSMLQFNLLCSCQYLVVQTVAAHCTVHGQEIPTVQELQLGGLILS